MGLAGSISLVELTKPVQTEEFPNFSDWVNSNYDLLIKECSDKSLELHVSAAKILYNKAKETHEM